MSGAINLDVLHTGVVCGDRVALAKAITLVESTKEEHLQLGSQLIAKCLNQSISSRRIGITGVPGAGKSTFIDAFGSCLTSAGHKVAVLAVDPSSEVSHGSILGDKTRMDKLSADSNAFIRPTPASGSLGGVARKTRETIILCEAAGYDTIIIETVGVGQSETAVHSMVDMFVLLVLATAGDELQGIKRGIMEMADLLVINKAEGDNLKKARLARTEYKNALHLFPPSESGWIPKAETCSALEEQNIDLVYNITLQYFDHVQKNGFLLQQRKSQALDWYKKALESEILNRFMRNEKNQLKSKELEELVKAGKKSPFSAVDELLDGY